MVYRKQILWALLSTVLLALIGAGGLVLLQGANPNPQPIPLPYGLIPLILLGIFGYFCGLLVWLQRPYIQKQQELENQLVTLENKLGHLQQMLDSSDSLRSRAEAANQAKSQYVANVSHELRTPLTAIIGYTELMREEMNGVEGGKYLQELGNIYIASQHLLDLVNDILDLAKIEAGRQEAVFEEFSIADMANDIASMVQPLVQDNKNKLAIECPPDIGKITTDFRKIRQCLFNLLSNASRFTKNGTITLMVAKTQNRDQDWFEFSVIDSGVGMNQEQLSKLFQAFSQAHGSNFGGTGLGLVITKKLAEMLGGTISVASQPGQGTTFMIRLPSQNKPNKESGT